ncbi:DUF4431 domain-containing protein [Methylomonas rosea]|uniref:DUF4431 domain-containing protein n=1 Tax=Methylomonas rosea TaxID=2952227 RepID=A0ABT1TNI0_9GAMM|nr:DUF4431 domain-containing protein [Methylomonas sp. WSC-7]MCQ8115936.1 DUF4431 domain-containing protein [Methylomonas sp. WSC-7]
MKPYIAIIWWVATYLLPSYLEANSCLHYGENPVMLAGTLEIQSFYGPPNYGETPRLDANETQAILRLSAPICVEANPALYAEKEQHQTQVTVVPLKNENLKDYDGKQTRVKGRLFHAVTGHHHTAVLVEIERIEILK